MKKSLLLVAGLAVSFAASAAAPEVGFIDYSTLIDPSWPTIDVNAGKEDKDPNFLPVMPAGTVLAQTENVTMKTVIEDPVSAQNSAFNGFKYVFVDGGLIDELCDGVGGNTNGSGNVDQATSGWMFQFDVKKDGWLIVFSKISSNKNFYAFEGRMGENPACIAYTLGMGGMSNKDFPDCKKIFYQVPQDADGYVDLNAADADKYFNGNVIMWPFEIYREEISTNKENAGNGTGFMAFPVYADAESYLCFATGSKMNSCGFAFVEGATECPAITTAAIVTEGEGDAATKKVVSYTFTGEEPDTSVLLQGAGIDNIATDVKAAELDWNAPVYNVMGQKVSKNFKGIAIQNGAKFVVK